LLNFLVADTPIPSWPGWLDRRFKCTVCAQSAKMTITHADFIGSHG
jgi:hypothetical protein